MKPKTQIRIGVGVVWVVALVTISCTEHAEDEHASAPEELTELDRSDLSYLESEPSPEPLESDLGTVQGVTRELQDSVPAVSGSAQSPTRSMEHVVIEPQVLEQTEGLAADLPSTETKQPEKDDQPVSETAAVTREEPFSQTNDWPAPPERALLRKSPEAYRIALEGYRRGLEQSRERLEAQRQDGLVELEAYRVMIKKYKQGVPVYRDGIAAYRKYLRTRNKRGT